MAYKCTSKHLGWLQALTRFTSSSHPWKLEDGEIDIRSTSFQGCVAKELRAMRNRGIHLDKYGNALHGTEESAADEDDDERDNGNHSPDGR